MTLDKIREIIEEGQFTYFGIRSDAREMSEGDEVGNSHQLFQDPEFDADGELVYPEGEGQYEGYYDAGELPGTCAILVNEDTDLDEVLENVKDLYSYYGGNIYLIGGENYYEGYDDGEGIIENAVVIAKI